MSIASDRPRTECIEYGNRQARWLERLDPVVIFCMLDSNSSILSPETLGFALPTDRTYDQDPMTFSSKLIYSIVHGRDYGKERDKACDLKDLLNILFHRG